MKANPFAKRLVSRAALLLQAAATCVCSTAAMAAVVDGTLTNVTVPNNIDGIYINLVTGATGTTGPAGWDINPYAATGAFQIFWPSAPTASFGGVATASPTGTFTPLALGTTVSSSSLFATNVAATVGSGFQGTQDAYLGFRFFNEATNAINYGYARFTTTAPSGFPATLVCYRYENTGAAITVAACGPGGTDTAPTLTYNPTTAAGVTFPTGPAGSVNSTIAITSAGAAGTGQSAVTGCTISGAGAASFGAVTTTPAGGIFNTGTTTGSINLSCTRGASAASASLSCTETATPAVAGSPFTRTWALTCPAATAANVAPVLAVAPTTLTGGTGSVTPTITTPAQGTGSTQFACSIPPTAPSNFTITSNASQTVTTTAAAIGMSCVPQAAATTATLTCTQTATPGPNPANATATITCPAVVAAPQISLTKTVGTVAGACAATDAITVNVGTPVYYCFQATNTGTVPLAVHTLVDSNLGNVLTNSAFALAPGATSAPVIVSATPAATVTNTATWTAATAAGYTVDTAAAFNYIPINATGTALLLADDGEANIVSPFPITYYGTTSTNLRVGNNGGILFNATTGDVGVTNAALPNATSGLAIYPFWDDIDSDTGDVYWQVQGVAPNRQLIVEWSNRPHFSNVGSATFEVIFSEGSNQIRFQYLDVDFGNASFNNGLSATVGLNASSTLANQVSFNQAVINNNQAILFTPAASASATDTATVTVLIPNIDVTPASLSATTPANQTTTAPLTIANTGQGTLNWNIAEEPVAGQPQSTPAGRGSRSDAREEVSEPLNKPGEPVSVAPFTGPIWRAPNAVLYNNGPLITNPGAGAGGANVSALQLTNGTLGFGHQVSVGNRVADDFVVGGSGWLINTVTFFTYQTGSTTTSTINAVNVRIWNGPPNAPGSAVVFGDTTTNRLASSTYSGINRTSGTTLTDATRPIMANVVTINTFLPAGTYWFDWQTGGTLASGPWAPSVTVTGQLTKPGANGLQFVTGAWAAAVDGTSAAPQDFPFVIDGLSDCSNPADVPWLSLSQTSGSNTAGTSTPITATFNATGLAAGTYSARLCATSNDPNPGPGNGTSLVVVPVSFAVTPSADLAIALSAAPSPVVAGTNLTYTATVTNLGPSPAQDASVSLPLPAGTSFVSASAGAGGSCTTSSPVVCTWPGATAPAGTRVATIVALVAPSQTAGLSATATVSSPTFDPVAGNNTATVASPVTTSADLLIGLTASATQVLANVPVTFTATSLNQGPSDAQNVVVTITLTPDFRFSSFTAAGATCTTPQVGTTGAIVCTWAGATAPGVTRTLSVVAYSNNEGTTAVNASTSSATPDPVANNNLANISVLVGYLTQEIPTLNGLGLILLGLMLGLVGFVAVRRQA